MSDLHLRIESDGTSVGTKVFVVDSQGRKSRISRVVSVDIHASVDERNVEAQIVVSDVELEMAILDGKLKFEGNL